jgi:hypothetical protein
MEVRSDRPDQPSTWHFSLEEAGTDERRGFPDLEALVRFLERELGLQAVRQTRPRTQREEK